jgi:hypothetical protein
MTRLVFPDCMMDFLLKHSDHYLHTIFAKETKLLYPSDQDDYKEMIKEVLSELNTRKNA